MAEKNHTSSRAIIALGANIGESAKTLRAAVEAVGELPVLAAVNAASSIYRSAPAHVEDQAEFANAVMSVQVKPGISAEQLLTELQSLENQFGRIRHEHWGPRTLDLDIIDFEGVISDTEQLRLPHPFALLRDFVVTPLLEIAPDYVLADGRQVTRDDIQYGTVIGVYDD